MRAAVIALPISLAVALATSATLLGASAGAEEPGDGAAQMTERATPTIYKWVDEHGIAHYTTDRKRIPDKLRDKIGRPGPPKEELGRPLVKDAPVEDAPTGKAPVGEAIGSQEAPRAPVRDPGEQWAVRDRSYERPRDIWDSGDDYGDTPTLEPTDEDESQSDTQVADQRQRLEDLDQRIREIAGRLPGLLADLRALQDERAQLEAP
jgi:hypothetical protein